MSSAEIFVKGGKIYTNAEGFNALEAGVKKASGKTYSPFSSMQVIECTEAEMQALRDEMAALKEKYGQRAIYGPECKL